MLRQASPSLAVHAAGHMVCEGGGGRWQVCGRELEGRQVGHAGPVGVRLPLRQLAPLMANPTTTSAGRQAGQRFEGQEQSSGGGMGVRGGR